MTTRALAAAAVTALLFTGPARAAGTAPAENGTTIKAPGATLYVEVRGGAGARAALPLVVVNGGPGFDHSYLHVSDAWDRISRGRPVVFYDQRGNGRSPALAKGQPCTLADQIEDLEAVRAHLGAQRIDLLGHSWGGYLAMAYAARHGDRVAHLVLCDSAAPKWSDTAFLFKDVFPEGVARQDALGFASTLGDSQAAAASLREYLAMLFVSPAKRDAFLAAAPGFRYSSAINAALNADLARFDLNPELPKLRLPALVLTGRFDANVAPSTAWKIHQAIAGSRFAVFETSGHLPFFEEPEAFVSTVETFLGSPAAGAAALAAPAAADSAAYPMQEGYLDAHGVLLYYKSFGQGPPLVVVHGGPGAAHDYFLPYLVPLARHHRLVFLDERGSGRSQKLADPAGYTVEAMVEDVEAARQALGLGRIDLLGHSYGGVLAQAYALKYQEHLDHLVLCSTFASTRAMNEVFVKMKERMTPELRARIAKLEAAGLFGHGKEFEKSRYPAEYMTAAWGEGYFPYLYHNRPDPNFDPLQSGNMSWDLYREMWGSHGEFVIDGNLKSVEYTDRLPAIRVPTLVTVGENDECDPSLARTIAGKIAGAKLVVLPQSGHMTFVDQPALFVAAVDDFLSQAPAPAAPAGGR